MTSPPAHRRTAGDEEIFERSLPLNAPVQMLWDWHMSPGAFQRLAPPWQEIREVGVAPKVSEGSRRVFQIGPKPVSLKWVAVHSQVQAPHRFVDYQEKGPFASWKHEHRMAPRGPYGSVLTDTVHYRLPLGRLGRLIGGSFIRADLNRLFAFRHRRTRLDLARRMTRPRRSLSLDIVSGAGEKRIASRFQAFVEGQGVSVHQATPDFQVAFGASSRVTVTDLSKHRREYRSASVISNSKMGSNEAWISEDDFLALLLFAIESDGLNDPPVLSYSRAWCERGFVFALRDPGDARNFVRGQECAIDDALTEIEEGVIS